MRRLKRWGTLAGSPLLKQALIRVLKVSVLGTTPAMPMSLKVVRASCRIREVQSQLAHALGSLRHNDWTCSSRAFHTQY